MQSLQEHKRDMRVCLYRSQNFDFSLLDKWEITYLSGSESLGISNTHLTRKFPSCDRERVELHKVTGQQAQHLCLLNCNIYELEDLDWGERLETELERG